MARSHFFRRWNISWPQTHQQQAEEIDRLNKRVLHLECLLAANAALTMALAEKAEVRIQDGLKHLDHKLLAEGPQQFDNLAFANHRLHDLLGLE